MKWLQAIRRLFKPKYENLEKPLREVYKDAAGNRFYELEYPEQVSYRRSIVAEQAARQAEFCLTRDDMLTIFNKMEEYCNAGNITQVFHLIIEMKERLLYAGEEETLLNLASVYFFLEGENIEEYAIAWQMKKIAMWKNDDSARCFFLSRALERTRNYMSISETSILNYLTEALHGNPKTDRLSKVLGRNSILIPRT